MSIATQISALQTDKTSIALAITTKGGTVASGDGFDDFANDIATIPAPSGNIQITQQSNTDVTNYETASVRSGVMTLYTPSISRIGLITASAYVNTTGWIESAPADATLQLSTQGATTITPSTSSQTAVSAGIYTTGIITVGAIDTESGTATANGTYTPTSGKYFNNFVVNIPVYDGSVS